VSTDCPEDEVFFLVFGWQLFDFSFFLHIVCMYRFTNPFDELLTMTIFLVKFIS